MNNKNKIIIFYLVTIFLAGIGCASESSQYDNKRQSITTEIEKMYQDSLSIQLKSYENNSSLPSGQEMENKASMLASEIDSLKVPDSVTDHQIWVSQRNERLQLIYLVAKIIIDKQNVAKTTVVTDSKNSLTEAILNRVPEWGSDTWGKVDRPLEVKVSNDTDGKYLVIVKYFHKVDEFSNSSNYSWDGPGEGHWNFFAKAFTRGWDVINQQKIKSVVIERYEYKEGKEIYDSFGNKTSTSEPLERRVLRVKLTDAGANKLNWDSFDQARDGFKQVLVVDPTVTSWKKNKHD